MKKIFMIFAVCVFASTELSFGLQLHKKNTLDLYENKYDQQGQCQIRTGTKCENEEEFVHFKDPNTNKTYCYEADNDGSDQGCQNYQTICILGVSRRTDGTGTTASNGCWTALTSGDDEMIKSSIQLQFCHDHDGTITTTKPWTGPGTGKELVFVAKSDEAPIVDENDKFAKSIIFKDSNSARDNILCIAYICPDGTNDGYGNPDGSCDTTPPAPDPVDPSPAPGPDPAPTPTPTNDGPHKNTVKPYLDALDAKCKK